MILFVMFAVALVVISSLVLRSVMMKTVRTAIMTAKFAMEQDTPAARTFRKK
jgi:hypothetical protein